MWHFVTIFDHLLKVVTCRATFGIHNIKNRTGDMLLNNATYSISLF